MKHSKTVVAFIAILLVGLFALSAETNNLQKIYPTTSEEYAAIKHLYIAQGHSLPSTTGPWSGDELLKMLENLDYNALDQAQRSTYDTVMGRISARPEIDLGNVGFNFNGRLNLELYYHTNTEGYEVQTSVLRGDNTNYITEKAFQGINEWVYDARNWKSFFNFEMETFSTDHFYANFQFDLANGWHSSADRDNPDYMEELGFQNLSSNILFFRNFKLDPGLFDGNFPYRSFLSMGGDNWNVQFGRDRLNWGAGVTGNMTISDNMPWQDYGKFTTYSKYFKYTFLTSFYPHPLNYWQNQNQSTGYWDALDRGQGPALKGLRMYIGHRVEGRFFRDRLTVTLAEGLAYMSEDNTIDFRALNPMNFNHNNYIPDNSNSTLSIEADFTPFKGMNVYGQFIVDEIAFPGLEGTPSVENAERPPAYGMLAGFKGAFSLGDGMLHANLEFAKTDPYLYLRRGLSSDNSGHYGIDYVVALRNWSSTVPGTTYDEYFLGYTYGPDAVVLDLRAGWVSSDLRLSLEGNLFYMMHGTHDAWTQWAYVGGSEYNYNSNHASPTENHTTNNVKYPHKSAADLAVEKTFVCGVNATYRFTEHLSAMLQADFVNITNYKNIKDIPAQTDIQIVAGATLSF